MIFAEQRVRWDGWEIEILGTDVSASIADFARAATYSNFQIQRGLGVAQMLTFFTETETGWQAKQGLRDMVRYEVHNVLHPPPYPGRFDLVLCRNVLLYFDEQVRERAFGRLSEALVEDGRLVLGGGETVLGRSNWFVPDEERQAVYRHGPAHAARARAHAA
jgi:chemotaxis protein methyltransferase CheR